MCLCRRDLFISVWKSVQLVIHVACVCLATSLGEGVHSFGGLLCWGWSVRPLVRLSLWLEIHPSSCGLTL